MLLVVYQIVDTKYCPCFNVLLQFRGIFLVHSNATSTSRVQLTSVYLLCMNVPSVMQCSQVFFICFLETKFMFH